MAIPNAVWGIEIGQCALKALKLRLAEEGKVELLAFDLIEHPKILSQPDADPDELITAALEKFVSRNDWQGDPFVIGVPGQQTFARFCKLPPVEAKKIPEIVRFEASQQIPFEMSDVVWDYQVFQTEDAPDVEVGIFAMRKDLIRKHLDYFSEVGIVPQIIQTIPSALYNFCRFEFGDAFEEGEATLIIDVGSQHTDLIVVEPNSAWSRNIPLGGNHFTDALVKSFKLSFAKAEHLKRTAATSKYARQIFQAMRPIFADLVAEIQRSIGFYSSTHRDVQLTKVLACGNAFNLPGLQKYLENNLTISGGVKKLDTMDSLTASATANAPQFADNIIGFGPAYGLALQGLGVAAMSASLLPPELARVQVWKRKRPYFVATAASLLLAAAFPWMRQSMDSQALAGGEDLGRQAKQIVDRAKKYQDDFRNASTDTSGQLQKINKLFDLQKERALIPKVLTLIHKALPEIPAQIADAETPEALKQLLKMDPARFERTRRNQMFIDLLDIQYSGNIDALTPSQVESISIYTASASGVDDVSGSRSSGRGPQRGGRSRSSRGQSSTPKPAAGGGGEGGSGFYVSIQGRLLCGQDQSEAVELITENFFPRLEAMANAGGLGFYIPKKDPKNMTDRDQKNLRHSPPTRFMAPASMLRRAPVSGAAVEDEIAIPDPVTGEDMSTDWSYSVGFKIKLGEPPEAPQRESAND